MPRGLLYASLNLLKTLGKSKKRSEGIPVTGLESP
jgi:hypothetical protein